MKRLFLAACLCVGLSASAEELIRVSVGARTRIPMPGLTAAYSLDGDCAETAVEGDTIVVIGQSPCTTHIVAIAGEAVTEIPVLVSQKQRSVDALRKAKLLAQNIQESGVISTSYSSNPGEVETSLSLARKQGTLDTTMGFSVANGYVLSPDARRTAIPYASLRFAGPSSAVTIFDNLVDRSPLTIENTEIRGLHVETGTWFLHGGIASLTGFRQKLFENDPDRTVDFGYRFAVGGHSAIVPSVQWIRSSHQYVSGKSGVLGSLLYEYKLPQSFSLQLEAAGADQGLAGAGTLEYTAEDSRLELRVRNTPSRFPGLSIARPRGFQGSGTFTHSFTRNLGLDLSGSRDTYELLDGGQQANTTGNARLQYRIHRFVLNSGIGGAELSRRSDSSIASISVPAGVSYDSRNFGNSFQYQYSHNRGQDLGSHSIRDSVRLTLGKTTFTAYGSRQTQTPTVSYLLVNVPWLEQALLEAGVTANTPEEIQQFIQTNADLIAAGYVRDLDIGLASVRRQVGAAVHWTAPRNLMSAKLEWRWDDYQRLAGSVTSTTGGGQLSFRLNHQTDLTVGGSLFTTRSSPQGVVRAPLFTIGIRRQLGNVPDMMTRFQQRGWIRGTVFTDPSGHGSYDGSQAGIAGVTVVLDGNQRTQTDQSGRYWFKALSEGKHWIEVQYNNQAPFQFTTLPQIEASVNTDVNFGIALRKGMLLGVVRNDAQRPLGNVLLRIVGPTPSEVRTSESGTFTVSQLEAGSYSIEVDPNSLPLSHVLMSANVQTVPVAPDRPGRVDFVVRALRSISGTIGCQTKPIDVSKVELHLDGLANPISVDKDGNFSVRDLSSGEHELTLTYDGKQTRTTIEIPDDAGNQRVDLEACGLDLRSAALP